MALLSKPSPDNRYLVEHAQLMCSSYCSLLRRDLVDPNLDAVAAAKALFEAPFVVVSHNAAADPVFNYGNQAALDLFEMSWEEFTRLPSRCSAEPPNREERARLLAAVTTQGFIDDYAGVRIAKTGKRFLIKHVTVWNLIDPQDKYCGQAAVYSHWQML